MKTIKFVLTILFILFIPISAHSQYESRLKEINQQVWHVFTKAFETSDVELFKSIHSKDLIRVNGDNDIVKNLNEYLQGYEQNWKNPAINNTISFRFIERINNEHVASERGIYKFTVNPGSYSENSYYGKFHVILRKEDNIWKLMVDYDSSENNTIDQEAYNKANPME